jgi:aminodeoxyfutalosine deaminase
VFRTFGSRNKHNRCEVGGKFTIYQPIILYRKFTADYIFNGYEIISAPAVLITNAEGTIVEITNQQDAGEEIERFRGLLTPGFINAHCHLELSHLKGTIPEKTGLVEFVQQVMTNRGAASELKENAMLKAENEMYGCGIVAVGDICNTPDSIGVKQKSKLLWHNFIEVSGFVDAVAQRRLADAKLVYDQFTSLLNDQRTSLTPHSPYSVSKTLFQLLHDASAGEIISIHNQECVAEDELYRNKTGEFLKLFKNFGIDISAFMPTGKSSFESWLPFFNLSQSVISVHNTFTSENDIAFCKHFREGMSNQFYYCICANANQFIEQKMPPIELLMNNNSNIIMGTDSYASNWQLDILEEIKMIQRAIDPSIPLGNLLQWATLNGAKALKLDQTIGSFEKGKMPGIVLIEGLDKLQTTDQSVAKRIL